MMDFDTSSRIRPDRGERGCPAAPDPLREARLVTGRWWHGPEGSSKNWHRLARDFVARAFPLHGIPCGRAYPLTGSTDLLGAPPPRGLCTHAVFRARTPLRP